MQIEETLMNLFCLQSSNRRDAIRNKRKGGQKTFDFTKIYTFPVQKIYDWWRPTRGKFYFTPSISRYVKLIGECEIIILSKSM